MINQIKTSLSNLRNKKPLILCLTNYVTMDFMANSLLSVGAAPLMSESIDEIEELVSISNALYINIGTLNELFMERAIFAAQIAQSIQKPIILDPVGAGASKLRTSAAEQIMPFASIIRGNASEIIALSGSKGFSKGVEATDSVQNAVAKAILLAQNLNEIVVISGPKDFITDGINHQTLSFGSELMPLITGMGCTMTAILSAFVAANSDHFQATSHATAYFGLCGQLTYQQTQRPGSFKQSFIDNLYNPDWEYFTKACDLANTPYLSDI